MSIKKNQARKQITLILQICRQYPQNQVFVKKFKVCWALRRKKIVKCTQPQSLDIKKTQLLSKFKYRCTKFGTSSKNCTDQVAVNLVRVMAYKARQKSKIRVRLWRFRTNTATTRVSWMFCLGLYALNCTHGLVY